MHELGVPQIALLCSVALAAGILDAIAGGGGLLTVPAVLWAGLPPHLALGTNKGQAIFGTFMALIRFARSGLIDPRRALATFPSALAGSFAGASLVLALSPEALKPVVVVLLAAAAVLVGLRRAAPRAPAAGAPRSSKALAGAIALAIGAYDGFFGPGTGTFLIAAFAGLMGDSLARASAEAKVANFASNLAALLLFAAQGTVVWRIALPMAAAQLAGGWLGAHLAIRRGDGLVRKVAVAVALALALKLAWDLRA
jgi:uncharacterized membrane protein YfcA